MCGRSRYHAPDGKSQKGFNQLHVNALFDLEFQRYVDAVIQPIRKKNEFKALLPRNEFSILKIKELYNRRWGIETSFCKLKHILGTGNFHSKKRDYISQEIWAK